MSATDILWVIVTVLCFRQGLRVLGWIMTAVLVLGIFNTFLRN